METKQEEYYDRLLAELRIRQLTQAGFVVEVEQTEHESVKLTWNTEK